MPRRKKKGGENIRLYWFRKKYIFNNYSNKHYRDYVEEKYFDLEDKYNELVGGLKRILEGQR